jgi:uncharacterized membrane protein
MTARRGNLVASGATRALPSYDRSTLMMSTTAPAVPDVRPGRARARALGTVAGPLTAAVTWLIEVPLLGLHLTYRFGSGPAQSIGIGQAIGASLAAGLAGWLVLAVLERRAARPRAAWAGLALIAAAGSLALPLTAATTASATAGLIVMHLAVGAAVIPLLARTAGAS